jgi:hypothetical protein
MPWIESSFEGRSPTRKGLAIVTVLLGCLFQRIASAILLAFAFVAGVLVSFGLLALLGSLVQRYWYVGGSGVFLLGLVSLVAIFAFFRLQTRRSKIDAEAAKWLADRSKESEHPSYTVWVRRARRWSLWAPTATVLFILLFLPETCGIVSHLLNHGAGRLYRYTVRIPLAWAVLGHSINRGAGSSYVVAWAGKGIAREWRIEPVLSSVSFGTRGFALRQDGAQPPMGATITLTRILPVGSEMVTCWEFPPHHMHSGLWNNGSFGFVSCSSSEGDFYASFAGQKTEVPGFYEMLQSVKPSE